MKKYDEVMEKISVTSEMRERILDRLEETVSTETNLKKVVLTETPSDKAAERKLVFFIRKYGSMVAGMLIAVIAIGLYVRTSSADQRSAESGTVEATEEMTAAAYGIEEMNSADDLSEQLGFPVSDLEVPFIIEEADYLDYFDEMAEINYIGESRTICYRKAVGTDDISGDFNVYEREEVRTVAGQSVTCKGNAKDQWQVLTWTDGTYAYAISSPEGLSDQEAEDLLTQAFSQSESGL